MLYRENEEFKLFPLQVTYKNSIGEEETNFAIASDTWTLIKTWDISLTWS